MTKLKLQQAYFSQRTTAGSSTQPLVWFDARSMELKTPLLNALRAHIPCLHRIRADVSTPTRFAFGHCFIVSHDRRIIAERFALLARTYPAQDGAPDWHGHVIVGLPEEWGIKQVLALESSVPWLPERPPTSSRSGSLPIAPLQLDPSVASNPQAGERRLDESLIRRCGDFLYDFEENRICVVSDDFARIRATLDELLLGLADSGWRGELSCSTLDGVSASCSTPYKVIGSTREIVDRLSGRAEWGILDADNGTLKFGQPASQVSGRAPSDWKEAADEALQSSGAEATDAPQMQDAQSQSGSLTARIGGWLNRGKPQSYPGMAPQGRAQDVRAARPKPEPPTVHDLFRAARAGMESAIGPAHSTPAAPAPQAIESQIRKSIESNLRAYLSAYSTQATPPAMSRANAALEVIWHGASHKDRDLHAKLIALLLAIEPTLDLKTTSLEGVILDHFRKLPASGEGDFSRAGFISACVGRLADRFLEGGGTQNGVVELITALANELLKQFGDRGTAEGVGNASLGALYEIANLDLGDPQLAALGQRAGSIADRTRLAMGGNRVTLNLLMRVVPPSIEKGLAFARSTDAAGDIIHATAIDHLVAELRLSAILDSPIKIETIILLISRCLHSEPGFVCPLLFDALRRHAGPSFNPLEIPYRGHQDRPATSHA